MYDLIIIGMGPGGIAASIYAKRGNLNVLCLEKNMPGGELNYIDKIDNYPGLNNISGSSLAYKLMEHIDELDIDYKIESVVEINKVNNGYEIISNKSKYLTKNIILATGRTPKKLGLENEDKLLGRGISHCAVCDGVFFKNKTVCIVGGGMSALQEALYLANIVNKVYIIYRKDKFSVAGGIVNKVLNNPKIEVIYNEEVKKINGNEYLESVTLKSGKIINTSGLFIYIGYTPSVDYIKNLDILDNDGYALVDNNFETKCKGVYAVGDLVKKDTYQIVLAMADGIKASLDIISKIVEK